MTVVPSPISLAGWVLVVVGFGFAVSILKTLRSKRTSTDAAVAPHWLWVDGPYALSRNPFYLCYVMIALGAACALGSLAAFIAPVLCFLVLHYVVIPLEERVIQKKFGQQYEDYKRSVRRWI
ncbi:MAG TPA: isoprenylcysteine carboxylmethyltransferase family protein [Candidatus Saccharimonadales bacterium]|nr:isoprenylcysteine carboxylmethyltransferase family protein [Candidatus Saccharimonadales bacterium]